MSANPFKFGVADAVESKLTLKRNITPIYTIRWELI